VAETQTRGARLRSEITEAHTWTPRSRPSSRRLAAVLTGSTTSTPWSLPAVQRLLSMTES
jgi:hypothetical protein